jgi:tetratricopeptide (TPR) repeat protein
MFIPTGRASTQLCFRILQLVSAALVLFAAASIVSAQGGTDYTGSGGNHSIQGRLFFPSGRRTDVTIRVRLENMNTGTLTVFADVYGAFAFKNLVGGSYTIVIEGNEYYEGIREAVFIDDGGSSASRSTARMISVPIHLQPKRGTDGRPGVLNAALVNVPKKAVDLYYKALETAQAGDAKKAVELLNSALAIHADFSPALSELGVLYLKLSEPGKAAEALAAALKLAPEDIDARLTLGVALLNRGDLPRAELELRRVLTKNEQIATAHMYLGMVTLKQNKFEEAELELRRAIELPGGEQLAQAHKYVAGLYWRRNEFRKAADSLEKYLKLTPKAQDAEKLRNIIQELRSKKS